ncbi:MAG: carbon-nitrogen hydrolase family protein [Spirochaetia bacterium]
MKSILACGQFAPAAGGFRENTERIRSLAHQAADRGAGILVLPELCLCGYPPSAEARSWSVRSSGPEIDRLSDCARESAIALCFGFAEMAPDNVLYNSMGFLDGRGVLRSVYRKVHLWVNEKEWALPGAGFPAMTAGGVRLGMWICYDTRFPEAARTLARSGATLALVGSAWFGPAEEWELALRARALDNGIFVAGASVQGSFGGAPFHGSSLIVDPHGRVLARAREGAEEVICAEYDDEAVASFRARLPLLSDLRPAAYA